MGLSYEVHSKEKPQDGFSTVFKVINGTLYGSL